MGKLNISHDNGAEVERTVDEEAIQEEIRRLAYELFCEGGCEHGHDVAHWVEAERRVLGRLQEE